MNKTMTSAQIVAHSIDPRGNELVSILATFPRIILAEVNTHRMLSKNTSSSRAIPFNKMIEAIRTNPFIPIAWQKHHYGMQGSEYFTGKEVERLESEWLSSRDRAIESAIKMKHASLNEEFLTKQLCNRLLEPFMWTTMLITGSKESWDNFFELRCPQYLYDYEDKPIYFKSKKDWVKYYNESQGYKEDNEEFTKVENLTELEWLQINKGQAEIHIMDLAEKIYDVMNENTSRQLNPGEWHIPFIDRFDSYSSLNTDASAIDLRKDFDMNDIKIATALAARVSYTTIEDEKELNYEKLIKLHDKLIEDRHDSPLEHCARAMSDEEYFLFRRGKGEADYSLGISSSNPVVTHDTKDYGWCNNFKGFIQYRYLIENGYNG